jgi:hypothetical protein
MDFMHTEHPFRNSDDRFVYYEHDFVPQEEHKENWLDEPMHHVIHHARKEFLKVVPIYYK